MKKLLATLLLSTSVFANHVDTKAHDMTGYVNSTVVVYGQHYFNLENDSDYQQEYKIQGNTCITLNDCGKPVAEMVTLDSHQTLQKYLVSTHSGKYHDAMSLPIISVTYLETAKEQLTHKAYAKLTIR